MLHHRGGDDPAQQLPLHRIGAAGLCGPDLAVGAVARTAGAALQAHLDDDGVADQLAVVLLRGAVLLQVERLGQDAALHIEPVLG